MVTYFLETVDSTQLFLKRLLGENIVRQSVPIACLAKTQSAGYGRRGSDWASSEGGLYFSVFMPYLPSGVQVILPAIIGTCIEEAYGIPIDIKWPNDIFFRNKKLAGVIFEGYGEGVIIGIGINIYNDVSAVENAVSIKDATGRAVNIWELFYFIVSRIISMPDREECFQYFNDRLLGRGRNWDMVVGDDKVITGRLDGIMEDGALLFSGKRIVSGRLKGIVE